MAVSTIAILTRCWTWKYCPRIRRTFASSIMRNSGCVASSPAGTVTDAQPARGRVAGARSSPERTTDGKRLEILRVFASSRWMRSLYHEDAKAQRISLRRNLVAGKTCHEFHELFQRNRALHQENLSQRRSA